MTPDRDILRAGDEGEIGHAVAVDLDDVAEADVEHGAIEGHGALQVTDRDFDVGDEVQATCPAAQPEAQAHWKL